MAGYTYEYEYSGWMSTGIFGISSTASGGSIKGRVIIEPVDESITNVAVSVPGVFHIPDRISKICL